MDLRLEQVLAAARARRAALSAETAGYIALGVADALAVSPGVVRESDVLLDADGNVAVTGAQRAEDAGAAERSVRSLLHKLLSASAGSSPSLSACARRQAGNGMRALVEELEAALIPVNRAAARRAIGRLAREASKVASLPSEPPRPAPRVAREPTAAATAPAPQPGPTAGRAADLFEAATEPEYAEQHAASPVPVVAAPQPVDTTPTELTAVESAEHTVPLELIPAEPTPGPASTQEPESQTSPIDRPAPVPPAVPDLEVGQIVRRPSPLMEMSPVPPTPAPPTPAPTRADPHGLTPQLSTYDPHTAAPVQEPGNPAPPTPPPPPANETPAWDDSYSERSASRAVHPACVVPEVDPAPGHVATAQPPDVVLPPGQPEPPRVVLPTPEPPGVAEAPEPSVPIDVVISATPPPARAEAPEPSVPVEMMAGLTPGPAPAPPAPPTPAPPSPERAREPSRGSGRPPARAPEGPQDAVGGVQVSGVDDLLASFAPGTKRSPREVAGELKAMVGLDPTPPPPEVATLTGASLVVAPGTDREDDSPMQPVEFRRPRAPRTSLAITTIALLLMLGAAIALYFYYPQFFTGR